MQRGFQKLGCTVLCCIAVLYCMRYVRYDTVSEALGLDMKRFKLAYLSVTHSLAPDIYSVGQRVSKRDDRELPRGLPWGFGCESSGGGWVCQRCSAVQTGFCMNVCHTALMCMLTFQRYTRRSSVLNALFKTLCAELTLQNVRCMLHSLKSTLYRIDVCCWDTRLSSLTI